LFTLGVTVFFGALHCNSVPQEPNRIPAVTPEPTANNPSPNRQRPTVDIPSGSPPATLQTEDIAVGTGAEARAGQRVSVQYTGVAWSTHREFDSSWNRGQPFSFTLGQQEVIRGWDQGVAGMRVGGRRKLIIPPAMGYGEHGMGPNIGPNETLVFVVDLVSVR